MKINIMTQNATVNVGKRYENYHTVCERGNILARWTHRGWTFQFNDRGEILKGRLVAQRLQLERHGSKRLKQYKAKQDHFDHHDHMFVFASQHRGPPVLAGAALGLVTKFADIQTSLTNKRRSTAQSNRDVKRLIKGPVCKISKEVRNLREPA